MTWWHIHLAFTRKTCSQVNLPFFNEKIKFFHFSHFQNTIAGKFYFPLLLSFVFLLYVDDNSYFIVILITPFSQWLYVCPYLFLYLMSSISIVTLLYITRWYFFRKADAAILWIVRFAVILISVKCFIPIRTLNIFSL